MNPAFQVVPSGSGAFRLVGELDLATVSVLTDVIEQLPTNRRVTLDLSELTFIDSSGLHALASCAKTLDGQGMLILANPTAWVQRVFELVGFAKYPPIEIKQVA